MTVASAAAVGVLGGTLFSGGLSAITAAYWYIGYRDLTQDKHTIRKNFPVLGNIRYLFEVVRPEIRQYLIEGDEESSPFSRTNRTVAYQRAKNMSDTVSLGTKRDVYRPGYGCSASNLYFIAAK